MTEIRTDESLIAALEKASSPTPSHDQVERQRVSFIMGVMSDESDVTREQIQDVLERQDGKKRSKR